MFEKISAKLRIENQRSCGFPEDTVEMIKARSGRCIASPSDIQGGEEHRSRTRYKIHLRKRYDYEPGTYYHDGEVESSGAQD